MKSVRTSTSHAPDILYITINFVPRNLSIGDRALYSVKQLEADV